MKDKNKAFIFIFGISLITLIVLVIGSVIFAKDSSLVFSGDGYIITSASERYYFKSGTTYKENLSHEYAFKDENNDNVSVSFDSFIHYTDNSLGFMQNGVLMDINSINMSMVPYYNITNKSTVNYDNGKYIISTANKKLEFDDILGRISENKYIVAGKDIRLKLPDIEAVVTGQYFEITFATDGVVKIENQDVSYQTTAQGTYIYVGDKVVIDFNSMKVVYDGEAEMSLSQITINGDENIDILEDDKAVDINKDSDGEGDSQIGGEGQLNNNPNGTGDDSLNNSTGEVDKNDEENNIEKDSYIEFLDASVTTNSIKASFKYNNTDTIDGNLVLNIIDIGTGNKVYSKVLDKTKKTDDVVIESLSPDTNYLMTIYGGNDDTSTQYFSQSFRTQELGIMLRKVYATSSSLTYKVDYLENTNINSVTLSLYNEKMEQVGSSLISNYNENIELTFGNLDSDTSYIVKVDSVVMNSLNYVNVYKLDRTDITLKKVPDASTAKLEAKASKSSAYLSISDVTDSDTSIKSYTFKIYSGNYNSEEENEVLYSKIVAASKDTKTASLKFDITDLALEYRSLGYYRFSVDITYFDNEKTMILNNQQISSAFFITEDEQEQEEDGQVRIDFEQDFDKTTYSYIVGKIKITDSKHKILVDGRDGYDQNTKFTIKYYSGDISKINSISVDVSSDDIDEKGNIVKDIELTGLTYNSGYIIEVYADMYDDDGNVVNQIVDRSFSGTTKSDIDKLKFSVSRNNGSDDTNVINFDGIITSTNAESTDSLDKITVKLYKGSVAEIGNQIGDTVVINGSDIFNKSYQFTNNTFGIADVLELTSLSGGTLYQNYTIQFTEAYYTSGNMAEVENDTYTYSISLAYMLERQLEEPTIVVSPINNGTTDPNLDESTVIGYEVTAGAAIEKLKNLLGDLGIESINYYIYKVDDNDEEILIKTIKSDNLSQELYFEGINEYNRGGSYVFKYDITIAGLTERYPTKPVTSDIYTPEKQSPIFSLYKSYSTGDSIIYKYKFTDIDDAIHVEDDGSYKFYYSINDSINYSTPDLLINSDYQELILNDLSLDDVYSINYYKETVLGKPILTEIENDVFESFQDINDYQVKYSLQYSPNDNRLGIHLEDNSFLRRIVLYEVIIHDNADDIDDYVKIFNNNDLVNCPSGDSNCLIVDYADIKDFIGKDTSVLVNVYYDNGLSGLDVESEYGYVFENKVGDQLYLNSDGDFRTGYSISLYNYSYQDNNMTIQDYFNEDITYDLAIDYFSNGVSYGEYGTYDPKAISYDSIGTDDDYFRFDSIIPKVTPSVITRTINSFTIGADFSGLTLDGLKSQFKVEDSSYNIYVDLCDDSECSNVVRESKINIVENSSSDNGYKVNSTEFSLLMPDTTYYYKLYAYLKQSDGSYQKVELFDASDSTGYTTSVYSVSTRGASEIFGTVAAYYNPDHSSASYDKGRIMEVQYRPRSSQNYRLKLQLLDSSDNDYFKTTSLNASNSLAGEEKIVDVVKAANASTWTYFWLDDNFVFGDGYYRLVLTAVSTTPIQDEDGNESYAEVVLCDQVLVTTSNQSSTNLSKVNVAELVDPTFEIVPSTNADGDIKVNITPVDKDKVIINNSGDMSLKRGYYDVRLVDSTGNNVTSSSSSSLTGKKVTDGTISIDFNKDDYNIQSDTYYYIYIDTYVYKNNLSLLGDEQLTKFSVSKIVYTSSSSGVALGSVSTSSTANSISLIYTGASSMDQIDRIIYSISVDGGSKLVNSKTIDKTSSKPIFSTNGTTYELSFTGLSLVSGNTYLVEIGYYHKNDSGVYEQLFSGNIPYTVVYRK